MSSRGEGTLGAGRSRPNVRIKFIGTNADSLKGAKIFCFVSGCRIAFVTGAVSW